MSSAPKKCLSRWVALAFCAGALGAGTPACDPRAASQATAALAGRLRAEGWSRASLAAAAAAPADTVMHSPIAAAAPAGALIATAARVFAAHGSPYLAGLAVVACGAGAAGGECAAAGVVDCRRAGPAAGAAACAHGRGALHG